MPYLVQWSEINHDAYCLALLFTYRDFSDGALGLAWVAEPELDMPGGICSKKVLLKDEQKALSFNAALATLLNYGVRIPRKASVITVMHELGHSFGSVVSILHAPSPPPPPPPPVLLVANWLSRLAGYVISSFSVVLSNHILFFRFQNGNDSVARNVIFPTFRMKKKHHSC